MTKEILPSEIPFLQIFAIRGKNVILDKDLARIYGVKTRRLNEQVRRNKERFPEDFMFRLTAGEWDDLKSQFAISEQAGYNRSQIATGSQKHRDPRFLPYAFTEHGAIQAANVLNSERAVRMGVAVVRAFVKLRKMALSYKELRRKIEKMEAKYDTRFRVVFDTLKRMLETPRKEPGLPQKLPGKIGFVK